MKTTYLLYCIILLQSIWAAAQSPELISFQATVRNVDGSVVSETEIAIKIAVIHGSISGNSVFEDLHHPTTSVNGLVDLKIGDGAFVKGKFSEIDWSQGPYFVKTSIDVNNGTSYTLQGTSQLLSVPYALHANTAERISDDSAYVLRARPIAFTTSRETIPEDIGNIIECTSDATLTLIDNFADMKIGDVISLEAHDGATLVIETDEAVTLNYELNGTAIFESGAGSVRFGLLRKIDKNAYIISGQ